MDGDKLRYEAIRLSDLPNAPEKYIEYVAEVRDILIMFDENRYSIWDHKLKKEYWNGLMNFFSEDAAKQKANDLNTREFNKKLKGFIND